MKQLTDYSILGRAGLKVSSLRVRVRTYGWGADEKAAREVFDVYRERGANFFASNRLRRFDRSSISAWHRRSGPVYSAP